MRPFRLLSIRRSLYGGYYVRAGRGRRLMHFPPFAAMHFNLWKGWM